MKGNNNMERKDLENLSPSHWKCLNERVARKVILVNYCHLDIVHGGFRIEKMSEEMAKQIEHLVSRIGGEVLLYPKIESGDIVYDIVVFCEKDNQHKLNLSKKKAILLALYEATKPFWSQYTVYRLCQPTSY